MEEGEGGELERGNRRRGHCWFVGVVVSRSFAFRRRLRLDRRNRLHWREVDHTLLLLLVDCIRSMDYQRHSNRLLRL